MREQNFNYSVVIDILVFFSCAIEIHEKRYTTLVYKAFKAHFNIQTTRKINIHICSINLFLLRGFITSFEDKKRVIAKIKPKGLRVLMACLFILEFPNYKEILRKEGTYFPQHPRRPGATGRDDAIFSGKRYFSARKFTSRADDS